MTSSSSMNDIIFIFPEHLGHVKGSTSYIFCIRRAQFLRNALDEPSGCSKEGMMPSRSCFFRLPLDTLL